jgi:hypothetical protein
MNFDAHSVAALRLREESLQCASPVLLRETPGQQAASKAAALMGAKSALLRLQRVYEGGDHRALVEALAVCACNQLPLPEWAVKAIRVAYRQFETGKLESWDDVFGRPYPGKSRKGTVTKSRSGEVWREVRRLMQQEQPPTDEYLFERAGKKLGMRRSTVSKLYYYHDRVFQPGEPGDYDFND